MCQHFSFKLTNIKTLLSIRITDSIIMWREVSVVAVDVEAVEIDYALSFQDTPGCQAIWYGTLFSICIY